MLNNKIPKLLLSGLLLLLTYLPAVAQRLTGTVVDARSGESIPLANVFYKGSGKGVVADIDGRFSIERRNGRELTISFMGYEPVVMKITPKTKSPLKVKLKEVTAQMQEVVVKAERKRYSRKNNPAVELMKRVVAARQRTQLENHDYYQYTRYQKISLALNNYRRSAVDSTAVDTLQSKKFNWNAHTEVSPYTGKVVMPLSVSETVAQHIFRKDPRVEKNIIHGEQDTGINQLLTTGEMINTALKEVFQDVDIYDDYVRLLQFPFPSPIGSAAVGFYRYYIQDTVMVDNQECYHLEFGPNNVQDFGFSGDLYILTDSTLHVKRCSLSIPKQSDVNFVENLHIDQVFTQLPNGEWALTTDDMWAEMVVVKLKLLAVRNTRLSDYSFDPIPNTLFRGKAETKTVANARNREDDFWNQYRTVELSEQESGMDRFIQQLQQHKGLRIPLLLVKTVAENYIETSVGGRPSKFDFGPVMSTFSSNFVDGFRLRLSGRTMGALNPHFFWEGYGAYGFRSKQPYYGSKFTYSFNKKKNSPFEFPQRSISLESSYDVMSPSDKFMRNDKDNVLMGIRTERVDQMYFYNRQRLTFTWETDYGLHLTSYLKTESNRVAGNLHFRPVDGSEEIPKLRTTELNVGLRYAPGQTYINTKQNRYAINFDRPTYYVRHTMGFSGFLGGQYRMNMTEIGIYKRQWLGSWGHLDLHLDAAAQWNRLPFPLLMTPPIALSYIEQEGTFNMLHNMEFFMDRKLFWSVAWDMNGKIFNRIPLLKKLKFREYIAFKGIWGTLTDKNNPTLAQNAGATDLFMLPDRTYPMDPKRPYLEMAVGIRNILHFFSVEWIHRFSYNEHPGTHPNGVRFGLHVTF